MAVEDKKKKVGIAKTTYYMLAKELHDSTVIFGMPCDSGLLIDTLKMTYMNPHRADQMKRIYSLIPYEGKDVIECKCGMKFSSEQQRDNHGRKRHAPRTGLQVKDLNECSEWERQQILNGVTASSRDDPAYWTRPSDFHTPDPEDRDQDRRLLNAVNWEQTEASQK